jgi:transcriptional regulator with XRE-family HTH domain
MNDPPFHELLTHFRELRGFTQERLATELRCSPASVSRWANDKLLPYRETAERLDELLEGNGRLFSAWKVAKGRIVPDWAQSLSSIEYGAQHVFLVSPVLVPGYLQCAEYAEYVFRSGWQVASDEEIAHLTKVRTRRFVELPKLRVTAVFPVTSLTWAEEGIRQRQAAHLLELTKSRSVEIHLVPEGALLAGVTSPLLVFRLRSGETVISSDHIDGNVIYEENYDRLTSLITGAMALSLPAQHSLKILEGMT